MERRIVCALTFWFLICPQTPPFPPHRHACGRRGETDRTQRQTGKGPHRRGVGAGGGDCYSMASWFSWSALISSPASLPSLLLLLFLCLCLRWLSPSSLSCLLLLLLLIEAEGQKCGKGKERWVVDKGEERAWMEDNMEKGERLGGGRRQEDRSEKVT